MRRLPETLQKLPKPSWSFLLYWGILFGASAVFVELAGDIREREEIDFDRTILTWLNANSSFLLTRLALFFDVVGNIYFLGPVGLLLTFWLWRVRRRAAVFFVLSMLGALGINQGVKLFFARARPDLFEPLAHATNFAFPSGHTMGSSAFVLALFLIAVKEFPRYRFAVAALGLLFALAVSSSRSYLQVHYPSDVVTGWALSVAWVLGLYTWFMRGYPGGTKASRARGRREAGKTRETT